LERVRLDVLDESFVMITPEGRSVPCETVRSVIEAAYGRGPMTIEIRNAAVHPTAAFGTYEEWHTDGGVETGRVSTAVMGSDLAAPNGLRWLHLQETWLPATRP